MENLIVRMMLILCSAAAFLFPAGSRQETAKAPNPTATIIMETGEEIHLELYPDEAPNTVANFISLAQDGFYDGLIFHRVVPTFMIQGGCLNGDGSGGPGYTIQGEFAYNGIENNLSHERGVISMARKGSGYDTAGSQFFIMHRDGTYLNGQYAAFGRVTDEESLAVVDKIALTQTDSSSRPLTEWRIRTITVDTHGVVYTPVKIQE